MRLPTTRLLALALSSAALGGTAVLAAGPAHADIGDDLCTVRQDTAVTSTARHGGYLYTIQAGRAFRAERTTQYADYVYGHGNGRASGWVPRYALTDCR